MLDLEFDKYKDQRVLELYENLLNKRHVTVPHKMKVVRT